MVATKRRRQNKLSPYVTDYYQVDDGSPDFKSMSIYDFIHWVPNKVITNKLFSIATPAVLEGISTEVQSHLKRWLLVNKYPEDSFDVLIVENGIKSYPNVKLEVKLTTQHSLLIVPKTTEGHSLLEEYMIGTIDKLNDKISRYESKIETAYNKINEYAMRVYSSAQSAEIRSLAELLKGR